MLHHMSLPRRWISGGSNEELWGNGGTYQDVAYDDLPPVGGLLDGSFEWLRPHPVPEDGMSFDAGEGGPVGGLIEERVGEAGRCGLTVPPAFARFMSDPALHSRVPSCTACYYDLGARLVPIPNHPGPERLLRFMNDQQACYLWYLLLEEGGGHQVAVGWPEWKEGAQGDVLEDVATPRDISICASTFEEFIKRFWIENAIWFAVQKGVPLDGELRAYSDAAKRAVARRATP